MHMATPSFGIGLSEILILGVVFAAIVAAVVYFTSRNKDGKD